MSAFFLPAFAFALEGLIPSSFFGNSPFLPAGDFAVYSESSGSIKSETKSSASTGGNSVGPGGKVQTGSASASSHSTVQSGSNGTNVDIQVETEINGVKQSESVKKNLKPGESVSIHVATSTGSGKSSASTNVNVRGWDPKQKMVVEGEASSTAASELAAAIEADLMIKADEAGSVVETVVRNVSTFMKIFVSFFWFW